MAKRRQTVLNELAGHIGELWRADNPIKACIINGYEPKTIFEDPKLTLKGIENYFDWCDNSPLYEAKIELYRGNWQSGNIPHMRAYTKQGCCAFIGVSVAQWDSWRAGREMKAGEVPVSVKQPVADKIAAILEWAETIMYEQKFTGAAAGLLNAGIVSRELKLSDRVESTGKDGGPMEYDMRVNEEAERFTRALQQLASRQQSAT